MIFPEPPRERVSAATADRRTEDRRQAIRGALLGLVIGERMNGATASSEDSRSAMSRALPAITPSSDDAVHDGDLARIIIEQGRFDARYECELGQLFSSWESGVPLALAVLQVASLHGSEGTDLAAAVFTPFALRYGDSSDLDDRVRHAATIVEGHAVGVDGAAAFAAALAAAARGDDAMVAARRHATTLELRRGLQAAVTISGYGVRAASLCEHMDTGSSAADAIPMALYCAARARTFADALGDALDATSGGNAVPACAGAIAGARFGANAISHRLASAVAPDVRERTERVAAALAVRSAEPPANATLS
jgi:hypothetical protein